MASGLKNEIDDDELTLKMFFSMLLLQSISIFFFKFVEWNFFSVVPLFHMLLPADHVCTFVGMCCAVM